MIKPLTSSYSTRWINTVAEVPQTAWDALAQPLITPFFEWDWLHNIESSGSATGRTGWLPHHLTVWRDQQLLGIAPLYVKGHSRGEFVFDNQWADVANQLGIEYYPKLLGMSPFTPAEGYRFMIAPGEDEEEITGLMVHSIDQFCIENKISGCNFLYVDPEWKPMLEKFGFASWLHHSYIWKNQEYETFDDYLKGFNANQRRNIKRERKAVTKAGLNLQTYTGEQIPKAFFSEMYQFYASTCDKFGWWGSKYLTRRFFEQLHHNYQHRVLFVAAFDDSTQHQPMGMSFCLTKGDRLYGRYWGSVQDIDCLHFDACYYSPIEWAIENKISLFDPGAGGRHKKRRGFPATANYSLHRFYDQRLAKILQSYIGRINDMEQQEIDSVNQDLPFSNDKSD
ncbi:MAG: GNAT family N-acetyltransferase [Oscillatoriales cyanobacterium CG2_30_40_61]|nr:MAG: GNAT family N-acetyltransferase [Oscillatoriales cyanobacterium CG2_30_40_61]